MKFDTVDAYNTEKDQAADRNPNKIQFMSSYQSNDSSIASFDNVKQQIVDFIMSVCDNCKNSVNFADYNLDNRIVETTSFKTTGSHKNGTKMVKQNGWNKTFNKLNSSDVRDRVDKLFQQNQYVTAGQTIINAANFYNVCYIVSKFLHNTIQIYASPCVIKSNGTAIPRKVIIFDNGITIFPYGKPEYIDKNYTAYCFQTYFNNLFDQLLNVNINTVTYSTEVSY